MKKILIVEDDQDIRLALVELLEDAGYAVTGAMNGKVAVDTLVGDPKFDLILLDLMMPVMDGFEFIAWQSREPGTASIPVLIMSADGQAAEKLKGAKVRGYVRKPLDMMPFLEVVARSLE